RALGPDNPDLATAYGNLALILAAQEKIERAEGHYRSALAIRERVLGLDHPQVADILDALASLLGENGRENEAELLATRAKVIRDGDK
ncbi:MAG: tetratricopeptide repeat protein, partial [Gammaproteobacteria bacterium]|nr:tetratricopeptide repeat protein [Gammaproteobacteria bacterium]